MQTSESILHSGFELSRNCRHLQWTCCSQAALERRAERCPGNDSAIQLEAVQVETALNRTRHLQ